MPTVVALDDVRPEHVRALRSSPTERSGRHSGFFEATSDTPDAPTAFLVEYDGGSSSRAHYHAVDQFQVVVRGAGSIGRHEMSPCSVHFARAYTPYGPLRSDAGWAFLTLRSRFDPGSRRNFEELKRIPGRQPWQISRKVEFTPTDTHVGLTHVPEISDRSGLFVSALTMGPQLRALAPTAAGGDGQFIIVVEGAMVHLGRQHNALAVVFIAPEEGAFELTSGTSGLRALILNFPKAPSSHAATQPMSVPTSTRKWQCTLCSFVYHEALGIPGDGIAPGTRWEDLPEGWSCPDCAASKLDFKSV